MAAPALVALAHASRDPRTSSTIAALVDEVKSQRPDLRVERAFLEDPTLPTRCGKPAFQAVVDRLVKAGHDEIVVVPLTLSEVVPGAPDPGSGDRRRRGPPPRAPAARQRQPRARGLLPGGPRRAAARVPARVAGA